MQAIFVWPIVIIFFVIILLAACIICVAIQNSRDARPRTYTRTSTRDPWLPVQETQTREPQWEPSNYQIDVKVCSCGKWNSNQQTSCWSCFQPLANIEPQTFTFETAERCSVCGFWVYPNEQVVLCPSCHAQGHRAHMFEYLKSKGYCPICNQKLNSHQLLNTVPILKSKAQANS